MKSQRQLGFALAAAIAFLVVCLASFAEYAAQHRTSQLWSAIGFAVVAALWFAVFFQRKRRATSDR